MPYKYFAFLSYNSKDITWGKRLQRKLEHYRMPATLCSEHNWDSKTPMSPVFFAPTDIQPGDLSEELKSRLKASRHLIVICSPNSAQSEWVGKEIEYFHGLGRPENIHFFIISGIPHSCDSKTECFNPIIGKLQLPEILGANINEKIYRLPWLNRERAYIQLITKLLGLDFDVLWNRHRRLLIQQAIIAVISSAIIVTIIITVALIHRPVNVSIRLNEISPENTYLPPLAKASITLILPNEKKDTIIQSAKGTIIFPNIPADMIGQQSRVQFSCENFEDVDTLIILNENITLNISRDINAFGHVHFRLYDQKMKPIGNTSLYIDELETESDENGYVDKIIPIELQRTIYHLHSTELILMDTLKDAKCGSHDAISARRPM